MAARDHPDREAQEDEPKADERLAGALHQAVHEQPAGAEHEQALGPGITPGAVGTGQVGSPAAEESYPPILTVRADRMQRLAAENLMLPLTPSRPLPVV